MKVYEADGTQLGNLTLKENSLEGKSNSFLPAKNPPDMLWATKILAAIAFGAKLTDAEDYIKEYMQENELTAPKDETEARDMGLALVGQGLSSLHRTLQQNMMRVFLAFVEVQAAMYEVGWYDLRNEEDTCRLCHAVWMAIKDRDDLYLRMV
jgi:hypothetical protein